MQFVDGAGTVLAGAEKEGAEGGGGAAAAGWFGREDKAGAADRAREKEKAVRSLRLFAEGLVTDQFLPAVYVDFRCDLT